MDQPTMNCWYILAGNFFSISMLGSVNKYSYNIVEEYTDTGLVRTNVLLHTFLLARQSTYHIQFDSVLIISISTNRNISICFIAAANLHFPYNLIRITAWRIFSLLFLTLATSVVCFQWFWVLIPTAQPILYLKYWMLEMRFAVNAKFKIIHFVDCIHIYCHARE